MLHVQAFDLRAMQGCHKWRRKVNEDLKKDKQRAVADFARKLYKLSFCDLSRQLRTEADDGSSIDVNATECDVQIMLHS